MGKEQELLLVPRELLQLLYSYGSIHTVEGVVYPHGSHYGALSQVARLLASRSSSDEAEVVAWAFEMRTTFTVDADGQRIWNWKPAIFQRCPPKDDDCVRNVRPLYDSPSGVKAGVTVPSVDEIEAIIVAAEPDIPASVDRERIWTRRMAKGLHSALAAALGVGDEGMGEADAACPVCHGRGEIGSANAADGGRSTEWRGKIMYWRKCERCDGTGRLALRKEAE